MSAMTRDYGDFAAFCLRPSASDHPGVDVLLKTNIKPQFDRPVTERSKAFFLLFNRPISPNFSLIFSL
jgi:hypothetical protein